MPTLREQLAVRLAAALAACGHAVEGAPVAAASDPRFGDYQSNAAMALAKAARVNPRELAGKLASAVDVAGLADPPEVAGAGFLNFRISRSALESFVNSMLADVRLGLEVTSSPRKIILDFSSPNVAKPMHVGHIRSTILGDCLARVARFVGHDVITDNHIGDWGTQFGKVIYGWKHLLDRAALERDPISELVRLYREVNTLEASDENVARTAREELVKLQGGDPENLAIWKECVELSWTAFEKLYDLLDVRFDERLGESAYNDALAPLCARLEEIGLAEPSDGALCVFFSDVPTLADKPAIVRKADGGFLYATTDLATIEYREARWNPDEIWYVVGAPQALHFQQVFEMARRMGVKVAPRHIPFGSILGENRKIMKTRSGENVGLAEVLTEALERAEALIAAKNPELPADERRDIARVVGVGAVKYAELSQHRLTDYVFSWDKMLAFQGNTAPYLQNAYVRIRSIFRKAAEDSSTECGRPGCEPTNPADGNVRAPLASATSGATIGRISLNEPTERTLAAKLASYPEVIPLVLEDFRPNLLANYLFELAETFHAFYEACPVLKAEPATRSSRLALCALASRVLEHGLGLLGIRCPERM